MTKVRTTMLSKNYYHCCIVKMEKWVALALMMHRKKFNKISPNNSDRLSYKAICWCLNIRDTPHFKLATLDIDTWYNYRYSWYRHLTYPSLGGRVQGLGSRLVFCMGKHTGRNNSITCKRYCSIAFIKATCSMWNVTTFGVLKNEPYKQELETPQLKFPQLKTSDLFSKCSSSCSLFPCSVTIFPN